MIASFRRLPVLLLLCLIATAAEAAITATGDYRPTYDGVTDPWDLGTETDLFVGEFAEGSLTVSGPSEVRSASAFIGDAASGIGNVRVEGAGALLRTTADVTLGRYGTGALELAAAGNVNVGGSLVLGEGGEGALSIGVGSTMRVTGETVVNHGSIDFAGGTLVTGGLLAAESDLHGEGVIQTKGLVVDRNLTVDAATTLNQQILLNEGPDQSITIDLTLDSSTRGPLGAGYRGAGSLTIADGLRVSSSEGWLGYHPGSHGTATVRGASTLWLLSQLNVGTSGDGTLLIEQAAIVQTGNLLVGGDGGSNGSVTVRGTDSLLFGSFQMAIRAGGSILVEQGAGLGNNRGVWEIGGTRQSYDASPASLQLRDAGTRLIVDRLNIGRNGEASVTIENGAQASAFSILYLTNAGGDSQITVSGAESWLQSRVIQIESSSSAGEIEPLPINLQDGGRLELNFLNGDVNQIAFQMANGGQLAFGGRRSGTTVAEVFGAEVADRITYWDGAAYRSIAEATPGVDYSLSFDRGVSSFSIGSYTVLTVHPVLTPIVLDGDYNNDGVVDAADYAVWRDNLGASVTLPGDTTPGEVTQDDYGVWAANYGSTSPSTNSFATPEPASIVLAHLVFWTATVRRTSRR